MNQLKISIKELTKMFERNLVDEDYDECYAILTHINKHHARDEKGRALFKRIDDELFQKGIGNSIKLRT